MQFLSPHLSRELIILTDAAPVGSACLARLCRYQMMEHPWKRIGGKALELRSDPKLIPVP
ncbi:hypothetical protein AM571_PC00338 (plasmid) [Rhizobium etli 8C-3]|uniref:Uncharacterized protein n=1 Tax=Rhizobium etli 8C-3 TaxID=538025 RepID=A0A1L5PD21_RHIET|nr:hypothetical protein AM571_PC00338 [Rhizobium etli 8C-3]